MDDADLRKQIQDRLYKHFELHSRAVDVKVQDGFVTLEGEVHTADEKATIEALVENVSGVKDVDSHLSLETSSFVSQRISG